MQGRLTSTAAWRGRFCTAGEQTQTKLVRMSTVCRPRKTHLKTQMSYLLPGSSSCLAQKIEPLDPNGCELQYGHPREKWLVHMNPARLLGCKSIQTQMAVPMVHSPDPPPPPPKQSHPWPGPQFQAILGQEVRRLLGLRRGVVVHQTHGLLRRDELPNPVAAEEEDLLLKEIPSRALVLGLTGNPPRIWGLHSWEVPGKPGKTATPGGKEPHLRGSSEALPGSNLSKNAPGRLERARPRVEGFEKK